MPSDADIIPACTVLPGSSPEPCIACGSTDGNRKLELPGDPLGGADEANFVYVECSACKTLRLLDVPEDMAPYYPAETYYSHQIRPPTGLRGVLQRLRDRGAVFGGPWPLGILAAKKPDIRVSQLLQLTNGDLDFTLSRDTRILDVGCGSGIWLKRLAAIGFRNLSGVDPFLETPGLHDGVQLYDSHIHTLDGAYDMIICSHALEHMDDPKQALLEMRRLLAPGGIIVIRIPLSNSVAWRMYGGHWVQLDAPRHLTLFSGQGFKSLVQAVECTLLRVEYDSTNLMCVGSLARQKGLLPHSADPADVDARKAIVAEFGQMASDLSDKANRAGDADQATFFFKSN